MGYLSVNKSSSDPAAKEVVNDLGGFLRQGEEGGPASGEGGGALKGVGKRAKLDLDAGFGEDATGPVNMIVTGEKDVSSVKLLEESAEVKGAFASGCRRRFGEDHVARDAGGGKEIAHGVGYGR